ncbi:MULTISPECIES: NADP-dependent malic enzyme [unclassified Sphingobium]|uniref:NADP-dependent malic enzyme n=1 Tax=unclassified Sphingobium TaxID=2611147 RepID=UPI000D15CCF1|nr:MULTISPECIES: NADP-dependent malic enzyme [unclassified Sphingobium]MBG6117028.1 malate dehydrogenase (oxaloacetate-decarboxylating)(NADP+) [Sphingobium sp. JAI105]PSO11410.1 NADP-dependent malic enzyme [Sphingobium sp. AEW4]TWD12764.1 malate dehydrogenase (oxaloacetate-decarboxylating)(NADP+) [Sphingobium sp. AEW010]TWD30535.1 malate dehydrogenase (oxaloacetate-decarboxylating)(NADP+) [Sphingobium sp. AEW013]TWD30710.1 malate dehydrogenase (oxaloacetate-decarboxylating)(NADP+) [Sphingobium
MDDNTRRAALDYHRFPRPGKLRIEPTKRMVNQRDLALAYSPGVAAPCMEIADDPDKALDYTARGNLVAVISNGTAVLGLGAIGALASKPVMEGKAVLFKKFADIDVFDIEIDTTDADKFVEAVALMEPTFGGINLEDIKAPECFAIEARLKERMNIPVFHDDQHGTAIVVAAAVRNALVLQGKTLADARLVTSGAGAAALACVDLLVSMGLPVDNVTMTDKDGVIHAGREGMLPNMARYARVTNARSLPDVLPGANLFLGLSAPGVLKPEWLPLMAPNPLIFALANPEPEIRPEAAREVRPDAIIATGRSDYPNQVNNVLCFPYIFRGALDVGATQINEAMKAAAAEAIAGLARLPAHDSVAQAYGGRKLAFGPDYIIPTPFDPRLIAEIAPAVAKAAMDSGVARRPIDLEDYKRNLSRQNTRSGQLMMPVFEAARGGGRRIAYGEGEDERVLRAIQDALDEAIVRPVIVARRRILKQKLPDLGLRFQLDRDVEVIDPETDHLVMGELVEAYRAIASRRGVPAAEVVRHVYRRPTVTAAMLLRTGRVDAALVGGNSEYWGQVEHVLRIIDREPGQSRVYALSGLILDAGALFITDTHMVPDPTPQQVAEMTLLAAAELLNFGLTPRAALLSHSNFGASHSNSARKMRSALKLVREAAPELMVDGEMHADAALSQSLRERLIPDSRFEGPANLLVMPNLDAANITLTALSASSSSPTVGPMLMGLKQPIHVLTPGVTSRGILNLTAIAAAEVAREG